MHLRFGVLGALALLVGRATAAGVSPPLMPTNTTAFIASLFDEAQHTFDVLSAANALPPATTRDDFEAAFVTMAIEEETRKVLASKGLTPADLAASRGRGGVGSEDGHAEGELGGAAEAAAAALLGRDAAGPRGMPRDVVKKDAPSSVAGVLEQLRVQRAQAELVAARTTGSPGSKPRVWLARPLGGLDQAADDSGGGGDSGGEGDGGGGGGPITMEVPCAPPIYAENWYAPVPRCSPGAVAGAGDKATVGCWRVVRDGVASAAECATLAAAAARGMARLFHQGGSTSLVPDGAAKSRLGSEAVRLVASLGMRVASAVELDHGLPRGSLHPSGSLLTRLAAEFSDDEFEMNHAHVYSNGHVDKANIASYDYSALLYLTKQQLEEEGMSAGCGGSEKGSGGSSERRTGCVGGDGGGGGSVLAPAWSWLGLSGEPSNSSKQRPEAGLMHRGGAFAFLDEDADRLVAPRCGRLLSFSSGLENPHRAEEVTEGERLVLALWFTCSPDHSYGAFASAAASAEAESSETQKAGVATTRQGQAEPKSGRWPTSALGGAYSHPGR